MFRNVTADGTTVGTDYLALAVLNLYPDGNGNGTWDGAAADGASLASRTTATTSGAKAAYSFGSLTSGTYFVVETNPTSATYVSTNAVVSAASATKLTNDVIRFVLVEANAANNNFYDAPQARTLSGTVYKDLNGNGTYEAGTDTARSGVTVTITRTGVGTYAGVTTPVRVMVTVTPLRAVSVPAS